jgi:transcriptional regulator with XRE-family HTH domain
MAGETAPRLGEQLKRYRRAAGLTQEALAEAAGLSVETISLLEREAQGHSPRRDTLGLLAGALGLREEERTVLEAAARRLGRAGVPRGETGGSAGTLPPEAPMPAPVEGSGSADSARAGAAPAVQHNLSVQLTRFIGREPLVATVRGLLSGLPEGPHLVTLTGVGGGGKTRVAVEAAAGLCERSLFPDGVFFVGLAPLDDPALVVPAIARTLGLPDVPGSSPLARLQEGLRGRRMLLLLDNMEHLVEAVPALAALLAACPALRVLVTSRAPLRLYGEREVSVPPLDLPAPEARLSVAQLAGYEAVRLFRVLKNGCQRGPG